MNLELISRAIIRATELHQGQFRKGKTKIPYIVHPLAVGVYLADTGEDSEIVAAGVLHDTIEDTELTFEKLEKEFGERVRKIVQHVSHKAPEGTPYLERYGMYLDSIRAGGKDSWSVALADKVHNMQSSLSAAKTEGEEFWKAFLGGMQLRIDFTKMLVSAAKEDVPDHPLLIEYLQIREEWLSLIPEDKK